MPKHPKNKMTWEEASKFVIEWRGQLQGMTLGEIAKTDEGLIWLSEKIGKLAPWQKEKQAIRVYMSRDIVQQELQDALSRRRIEKDPLEPWYDEHAQEFEW